MKYRQRVKKGMTKNIKRIDIRKIKSEYLSPITNLDDISIWFWYIWWFAGYRLRLFWFEYWY